MRFLTQTADSFAGKGGIGCNQTLRREGPAQRHAAPLAAAAAAALAALAPTAATAPGLWPCCGPGRSGWPGGKPGSASWRKQAVLWVGCWALRSRATSLPDCSVWGTSPQHSSDGHPRRLGAWVSFPCPRLLSILSSALVLPLASHLADDFPQLHKLPSSRPTHCQPCARPPPWLLRWLKPNAKPCERGTATPMANQPGSQEAPGAAYLRRRLERATAVPPEQRSPEVAAFVESAQLLREALDLLPLTASGQPSLPTGPTSEHHLLLALCKLARVDYLCPPELGAFDRNPHQHAYIYLEHMKANSFKPSELAWALLNYVIMYLMAGAGDDLGALAVGGDLVEGLGRARARQLIDQQLQQLAGSGQQSLLLTAHQLQYTCCCAVAHIGGRMAQLPGRAAQEAISLSCEAVLRLEPEHPQSWVLVVKDTGLAQSVQMFLHAVQLAQQQRSDWWVIRADGVAMSLAATGRAFLSRTTLEATLAAAQQMPAALQRCRGLLPEAWAEKAKALVQMSSAQAAIVSQHLQRLQQDSTDDAGSSRAAANQATEAAVSQFCQILDTSTEQLGCKCHGCGREAVGLRKCSRCKQAQYCRYAWQHGWSAGLVCHQCRFGLCVVSCPAGPLFRSPRCASMVLHCVACPPSRLQPRVPEGALAGTQARMQARLKPGAATRKTPTSKPPST